MDYLRAVNSSPATITPHTRTNYTAKGSFSNMEKGKTCAWPTSGFDNGRKSHYWTCQTTIYLGRQHFQTNLLPWPTYLAFGRQKIGSIWSYWPWPTTKKWSKVALAIIFLKNFTSKTPFEIQFPTYLCFWNVKKAWKLQFLWKKWCLYFDISTARRHHISVGQGKQHNFGLSAKVNGLVELFFVGQGPLIKEKLVGQGK